MHVTCQVCGNLTKRRYWDRVVSKLVCDVCFEPHRIETERLVQEDKERSRREFPTAEVCALCSKPIPVGAYREGVRSYEPAGVRCYNCAAAREGD